MTSTVGFAHWIAIVTLLMANQISPGLYGEILDLCPTNRTNGRPLCNKMAFCGGEKRLIIKARVLVTSESCDNSVCGYTLFNCCFRELLSIISENKSNPIICHLTSCGSPIQIPTNVQASSLLNKVIRMSYGCEDNTSNEEDGDDAGDRKQGENKLEVGKNHSTETDSFPVAGYAGIGLALALVIVIVAAVIVILRRKKRRNEREDNTEETTARTNKAYETIDNSNEQNNTYEAIENSPAEVYSEIRDTYSACEKTGDGSETTEYNKLNLRFLPVHNDPTYGFDSASTITHETHSNANENVLAKTADTYNHLTNATSPRAVPSGGGVENTYNFLHFTGEDTTTANSNKAKIDTYNNFNSATNGEGIETSTGKKEAGTEEPDHDYFVLENPNNRPTTTDAENVEQDHDYFTLEKTQ